MFLSFKHKIYDLTDPEQLTLSFHNHEMTLRVIIYLFIVECVYIVHYTHDQRRYAEANRTVIRRIFGSREKTADLSYFVDVASSNPSIPLLTRSGPLKPARESGECCELPQWGLGRRPSRHRFWCILRGKNSFDSNYYMDFCILKFIKL